MTKPMTPDKLKAIRAQFAAAEGEKAEVFDVMYQYFSTCLDEIERLQNAYRDAERRVNAHIKGESCKRFCKECTKPLWFVDDEDMTCRHCGATGFPVPDIDAEQIA